MGLTVRTLDYEGAAEIRDFDCSRPLDAKNFGDLNDAFLRYPILAFRNQNVTPSEQVVFSEHFGNVEGTKNSRYAHPDDPRVLVISNELAADGTPLGVADAGDFLHSDLSPSPEPSKMTLLHAIKNPSRGGDTEFVNMYEVYDALPEDLKRFLSGRYAWHHTSKLKNPRVTISGERGDAVAFYRSLEAIPEERQPVVRTHPETGRQALYVSPRFTLRIDDMGADESEALLRRIFDVMNNERFLYRYKWQDGDLLMWDNRCLCHRATGGYAFPDTRRMHRTSVAGDKAFYDPKAVTPV
jgi:taurine dioxygenase